MSWDGRVEELVHVDGWQLHGEGIDAGPFDTIVVAVSAEQVGPLIGRHAPAMAALAEGVISTPCWTAMVAFGERLACEDVVRDSGAIGWAARNSAKPGRSGPETWVIQAGPDWSANHLELAANEIAEELLSDFATHVVGPLPKPIVKTAHRWRYARSGTLGGDYLWDAALNLGVCGDWLLGPRVESAWLSGHRLGTAIGISRR